MKACWLSNRLGNSIQGRTVRIAFAFLMALMLFAGHPALAEGMPWAPDFKAAMKCAQPVKGEPLWKSRCYDGTVTLANYDTPASIVKRLESGLS